MSGGTDLTFFFLAYRWAWFLKEFDGVSSRCSFQGDLFNSFGCSGVFFRVIFFKNVRKAQISAKLLKTCILLYRTRKRRTRSSTLKIFLLN